ncbi:MAG: hypothetical protein WC378_00355, partial [Opitutaceae bacterium]
GGILVIEGAEHRLDLPDAAIAAGVDSVSWGGSATGITIDGGVANLIGRNSDATLTVDLRGCDTDLLRGAALAAAITAVQALTPGGAAISSTNRAKLLIPEVRYNVAALEPTIAIDGIDLIAIHPMMGGRRQNKDLDTVAYYRPSRTEIYTTTAAKHALIQGANASDVRMTGFTVAQLSGDDTNTCHGLYVAAESNDNSVYDQMYFWHSTPLAGAVAGAVAGGARRHPVGFAHHVRGTWTRCISNSCGWRINSTLTDSEFSATMLDCEFGGSSVCGDSSLTAGATTKMTRAILKRCHGIGGSTGSGAAAYGSQCFASCAYWGTPIDSTCLIEDCSGGEDCVATGRSCAATIRRCRFGSNSCGGTTNDPYLGSFTGYAEYSSCGPGSFGGAVLGGDGYGGLSGHLKNCVCLGNEAPTRLTGAVLDGCVFTQATTNKDMFTLLDSNSKISHSTIVGNGTGKAINAATALTFYGVGNSYVGGLGINVTAGGTGDQATLSATGADLVTKTSTFALAMADAIEAALVNDGDSTALLQAIADKFEADFDIEEITLAAVASAVATAILASPSNKLATGEGGTVTTDLASREASKADVSGLLDDIVEALAVDGVDFEKVMAAILATAAGKVAITDNGDGTYTAVFKRQDGSTTALSVTYNPVTGARTITGTVPEE